MVDSTLGNKDQVETSNNNKNQNQGTCASSCGVNQAYVEKGEATGTVLHRLMLTTLFSIHGNLKWTMVSGLPLVRY